MKDKTLAPSPVCKNCGSDNFDKYCSSCGQKTYTQRFILKSFFIVLWDAFSIERGFLYTMRMLFFKPGVIINDYINGKTKSYFNPLKYALITAGLGAFLTVWLGIIDQNIEISNEIMENSTGVAMEAEIKEFQHRLVNHMKQYMNIFQLFMIPFFAMATKWLFTKRKLFYGEHLIINYFLFSQTAVLTSFILLIIVFIPSLKTIFVPISTLISFIYYTYGIKKTFRSSIFKSIGGSLIVYILGILFFMIVFSILLLTTFLILIKMGINPMEVV